MNAFVILKLGGALITDKEKPFSVKHSALYRVCREIGRAYRKCGKRIIIVHGGGSYGHYVVREHGDVYSIESISQVVWFMRELNMIIADVLNLYGIPALPMDTHAMFLRASNKLYAFKEPLITMVNKGLTPVLYGDIVFNEMGEPEILSGDEIAWYIASLLKPSKLLFATSVDGVFDRDPTDRSARLLSIVKLSELDLLDVRSARGMDVTGGMRTKLSLGLKYMDGSTMTVYVFNGLRVGNIYHSICDDKVRGTRVVV
ncbi:MAG: isopentenyl phosphate kinase [Ignisphaera sp.]|nr:isopentenyl phosphate kinase [Ignisphaera sp.]MCX8167820.1 isopentenyl phosphate kinase [Ignisphaera sp.]MDW8085815.1 isopentenyl phosphate kinase [Ignisphaera sp.]